MSVRRALTLFAFVLILASGFIAGRASAAQPHMVAALDHLRAAKVELDAAAHDKAGHREAALKLVNDAIHQVELGIGAAAERH